MSRWAALALAGLAASGAVLGAALARGGDEGGPAPARIVAVTTDVSPRAHSFGDRVVATLEIRIDRELVNPSRIIVTARFRPYSRVGPVEITRSDDGRVSVLRYAYPLQCVDRGCAPLAERREFQLPPVQVHYPAPLGDSTLAARWPALLVSSGLTEPDGADSALREAALPGVSYRVAPALVGWLAAGLSAALVLAAGATLAVSRPPAAPASAPEPSAEQATPLEGALALVERAAAGGEEERRTALEHLARALDGTALAALVPRVRRLAWSAALPEPGAMADLAASVRRGGDAG